MNRAITLTLGFAITATMLALAQAPRSVEAQFKAAQHAEEVEGDLKKAIEEYRQIARNGDRVVAVRALIRLAECHQKLGDAESKSIYERIVRDYSEQKDAVALARGRLAPTLAPQPMLTTQRVLSDGAGRVSPDGRYVSVTDRSTNNLALRDLATSQIRAVTKDGVVEHPHEQSPGASAFSRDGKQVAYDWYIEADDSHVLRVIAATEGASMAPRTLHYNADISSMSPTDWSPDGRWLAVVIRRKDRTAQIGMVHVSDASLRVLKTVDWAGVGGLRFSPDGSMLAYHRPAREGAFERDVFVIAADGAREMAAAGGPSDDSVLEWTPDGQRLLIASDRGGSTGVWSVPFAGGATTTSFNLVKADVGAISSMGLTRSGTLFYNHLPGGADIHVARFDAATGQLTTPPTPAVQQFKGMNTSPEWSSDGRFLAYLSTRDVPALIPTPRPVFVIQSVETGHVREVFPRLSYVFMGRWSPDDRLFLARGADLKGRSGIVKIDATTGDASVVVSSEVCSGVPSWSRRGTTFFCHDDTKPAILEVDLDGNVVRSFPAPGQALDISPDGRNIVYLNYDRTQPPALKVLSLADGASREILRLAPPRTQIGNEQTVRWTPDGRNVVFVGTLDGDHGMWVVPIDGSAPHKAKIDAKNIGYFRFNVKTDQVAYSPSPRPRQEVWKMENFLPVSGPKR